MQLNIIFISWARAVWIIRSASRMPSLFIVLTTTPSIAPAKFNNVVRSLGGLIGKDRDIDFLGA